MRKIILIRHGKSSWKFDINDRFRPLKSIGIIKTIKVCKNFKELSDISLLNVFSSPAKRALETCYIFVDNFYSKEEIEVKIIEDLYDLEGEHLLQFITSLHNSLETVFIFAHNNAITNFVNTHGDIYIKNVPTSGLVYMEFDIDNWAKLNLGKLILKLFPKDLK